MPEQRELAIVAPDEIDRLVEQEKKSADYDTTEFTAEIMAQKLENGDIEIPPYQRPLVWPTQAKSFFIESLLLALPIPYMFLSERPTGTLEVVDGSQRLRTIQEFFRDKFRLQGLEKLDFLNGRSFSDLPVSQQRKLRNRPVRAVVLSERANDSVRFDIFHRINTGGTQLSDAQIRKGAFPGPFYSLVERSAKSEQFIRLCPSKGKRDAQGEREELVLRFYVYAARYQAFVHDVARFLNEYIGQVNHDPTFPLAEWEAKFSHTMTFVEDRFPYGFHRSAKTSEVPRVRFEAIAVGSYLALGAVPNLVPRTFDWLDSAEFQQHVRTDASNSGPKLRGRIEFVRDRLLEGQ